MNSFSSNDNSVGNSAQLETIYTTCRGVTVDFWVTFDIQLGIPICKLRIWYKKCWSHLFVIARICRRHRWVLIESTICWEECGHDSKGIISRQIWIIARNRQCRIRMLVHSFWGWTVWTWVFNNDGNGYNILPYNNVVNHCLDGWHGN